MRLAVLTMLAGCQVQHTTVVEQANAGGGGVPVPVRRPVQQRSPCTAPAGSGPFESLQAPYAHPPVPSPPRAVAEHVNGCAGIRFRIGPDGAPTDVEALTEYPIGYGFAETARAKVEAMRWAPRDDLSWRFLIVNIITTHPG